MILNSENGFEIKLMGSDVGSSRCRVFADARYQEFTCKCISLTVADLDISVYTGASVQWSEGAWMGN